MKAILSEVLGKIPIPSPAMVVALLALLIAASGTAVAAISFTASDGTITACRDNRTGALRVIQSGQTCYSSKETTITWKDGITGKVADADKLDGKDSSEFAAAYERTVVVSPIGTNAQNGQALLDALDGITDASAIKPYLLYIEPGTYDLGSRTLAMKQHVDVQGAGQSGTVIVASGSNSGCDAPGSATVSGASNAELRFLTARNASTSCSAAISNLAASPRITHVTASAEGASGQNFGILIRNASEPTITDVTATASGGISYGVWTDGGSPTMTDLAATASGRDAYGVRIGSGSPTLTDLAATASGGLEGYGVRIDGGSPTLAGGKATASGAVSYGVRIANGSPTMTDLAATASGPVGYGVRIGGGSSTLTNVAATASGESRTYGVWIDGGSTTLTGITATAGPVSSLRESEGAHIGGGSTTIRQSTLQSDFYALSYDVPSTAGGQSRLRVATTQLASRQVGGALNVTGGGTLQCFDNYNQDLAAVTCP